MRGSRRCWPRSVAARSTRGSSGSPSSSAESPTRTRRWGRRGPGPRPASGTGPGGLPHLRRDGDGAGSLQLSRGRGARARLHSLPGPAGLRRAQPPHGGRVAPVQCLQGHGARRHRAARRRWRRRPGREGHRRRGLGLAHRPGAGASLRRAPHRTLSSRSCRWTRSPPMPGGPRARSSSSSARTPRRITRVSHLGFIVQRSGHTYLRHATRGWKDGWWTRSLTPARPPRSLRLEDSGVSLWEIRDPRPAADAVSSTTR